jgi:hypothetical protein
MGTTTTEQIVREAPDIEAYKLGLLTSAKNVAEAQKTLPAYSVAGFNPDQTAAFEQARQGIGAYQPYLGAGTEALQQGVQQTQQAANVLQQADTRNQYGAAQQATNFGLGAAGQIGAAADQINPAYGMLGQGAGLTNQAVQQGQMAANQGVNFNQGINALYAGADQGFAASRLGAAPTTQAAQMGQTGNIASQNINAPSLSQFQMGPAQQVAAQQAQAGNISAAQSGFNPSLQAYQMGPAERISAQQVGTPLMSAAQTGFNPALQQFQMGPAREVSTSSITAPGSAEAYMSPYIQNALQPTLQEMQRQADIQATRANAQAVGAGAFGGSRQAIERAEANRNLLRSKSDVIAQGMQGAFSSAQQQFNAEQQARLAANSQIKQQA